MSYIYLNLQDKCIYYSNIISMHNKGMSFIKIAKHFNVSDSRIGKLYHNAIKVISWENESDLWRLIKKEVALFPASYGIRMYGLLLRHNIKTIDDFMNTDINTIKSIKGIGISYFDTLCIIRDKILLEHSKKRKYSEIA